jgi:hypothetical protein
MHSAIVVIRQPDNTHRWNTFIANVDQLQRPSSTDQLDKQTGVARLAENVWMVSFLENPAALARLVHCAIETELSYGILQLDAAPQWLPAGFDPKPK